MKKFFLFCLLSLLILPIFAQEDISRVSISAVQPTYENIPEEASSNLETRMQRLLSNCGLSNSGIDRFIMTARIDVNKRDINTAGMIVQRMDITFVIGDLIEEKVYGMYTLTSMGIGETETKSFINAFQAVKPNNQALLSFINQTKEDIITFYTNNCSFVIEAAERMASSQQYDEAIKSLISVPNVNSDCYSLCQQKAMEIYPLYIDFEGKKLIQQAKNTWATKHTYEYAEKALNLLSQVNPDAACAAVAENLVTEINKSMRQKEAAEWAFSMKRYEDNMALQRQKQADKAAILGTLVGRLGKIDIGIKKEKAFKLGSLK